jgi:polysaccharide deacetylase family protein (PEP-CTERM system associated)
MTIELSSQKAGPAPTEDKRSDRRGGSPESARKNSPASIVNAMTVDVEDYFHVRAFERVIDSADWDRLPARVEPNTDRVLNLFAAKRVSATFFVLGWVAERYPALVRRIACAGHEIASHGYRHEGIDRQSPDQFRADVSRSKLILEDIGGQPVRGYRAPTFSIGRQTWWAYDILAEEGYSYSSSIYPVARDLYGMPDAPRAPFHPVGGSLLELPLSTIRSFGRNFPASGGGFFRLLPYGVSRWAIARAMRQQGNPCTFYCHPWELDPEQPRIKGASFKSRFRHYTNLDVTEHRITRLLDDFRWSRIDDVFRSSIASLDPT